jgi:hypothetical protein
MLGPSMARHTIIRAVPAHLVRRAMNNLLTKKAGKYFIFIGIFEPTEYDDHNI